MNVVTPVSSAEISALWLAMTGIYGHRWTSAYAADPRSGAGDIWARALAGLTPRQIGQGVEACIAGSYSWPPTAPEFRSLCFGIPVFAAVRLDTEKRDPFTFLVWQHLDGFRYRQASADQADRMLREAYDLAREHVMRGGALPEMPAGEIEHEKTKPVEPTPEHKQDVLAKVRAELEPEPQPEEAPTLADAETVHEQMQAAGSES